MSIFAYTNDNPTLVNYLTDVDFGANINKIFKNGKKKANYFSTPWPCG